MVSKKSSKKNTRIYFLILLFFQGLTSIIMFLTPVIVKWTTSRVESLLGDPSGIGFGWGIIFGGWTLYTPILYAGLFFIGSFFVTVLLRMVYTIIYFLKRSYIENNSKNIFQKGLLGVWFVVSCISFMTGPIFFIEFFSNLNLVRLISILIIADGIIHYLFFRNLYNADTFMDDKKKSKQTLSNILVINKITVVLLGVVPFFTWFVKYELIQFFSFSSKNASQLGEIVYPWVTLFYDSIIHYLFLISFATALFFKIKYFKVYFDLPMKRENYQSLLIFNWFAYSCIPIVLWMGSFSVYVVMETILLLGMDSLIYKFVYLKEN